MNGHYLQRLGISLPPSEVNKASLLMKEGYIRSMISDKENLLFTWAEWNLLNNRKQEALTILQQGINRFPDLIRTLPSFLMKNKINKENIRLILPPRVGSWIQFGAYIEKLRSAEEAEFYYRHALNYVSQEEKINPNHFIQVYRFYRKQKQPNEAIAVLRQGIEWLPDYAPFHITLGDYYKQESLPYKAREEYEQALILDPDNKSIKKRIESLQ